jgi:hypothetical protein
MTQIGRLPAWIVGRRPLPDLYASPKLPLWPGLLGIAALAAITVLAARRRQTEVLWLVLVVVVAGFAAAAFIDGVDGPDWSYLANWMSSIGVVLWIAVGVGALTTRRRPVRSTLLTVGMTAVIGVLAAGLAIGGTWNALAAPHPGSTTSPDITHLAATGRQWAKANRVNAVKLDFGADPDLALGVLQTGTGVVLQLERHGIAAKVDPIWRLQFGPSRTIRGQWRGPVLVVGTSYEAPPGSTRLTTSGPYILYAIGP